MSVTTAEIERELAGFLSTAYSGLIREYALFTAAMLVSCAAVPAFILLWLIRRDRKRAKGGEPYGAYTHKRTTPLGIHHFVMILIPALAARELYCSLYPEKMAELIVPCAVLVLLAVLAAAGLFRLRVFGLLMAAAFTLGLAAYKQYKNLLSVAADMRASARYGTVGQYTLYIVDDYLTVNSMAAGFAALAVLALLTVYYYRRRFLFMPGLLRVPVCEYCGQVVSKGDDFCTCCGRKLSVKTLRQVIEPLDNKLFCGKCGSFINKSLCIKCSGTAAEVAKKTARENLGGIKTNVLWGVAALAVVCVLVPLGSGWRVLDIQSGSGRVNDAFAERLDEFRNEPGLASDAEWLAGFESAAEALYQADARWLSVKPRKVQSSSLAFFMVYSDASFQQMKMLEQSVESARKIARGELGGDEIQPELEGLYSELVRTNRLQVSAMQYYGEVSAKWDYIGRFLYVCYDGLMTLLPLGDTRPVSVVFLICCAVMLTYMLKGFSRAKAERLKRLLRIIRNRAKAPGGPSAAYRRSQRVATLVAVGIIGAAIGIAALPSANNKSPDDKQEYLLAAKAAASDYAVGISEVLLEIGSGRTMTKEDGEALLRLIRAQIAADQIILGYDMAELEDYQTLHTGLQSLCRDDIGALERITASIEKGEAPPQELIKNYAALRGENYLWVIEQLPQELSKLTVELALDM